MICEMSSNENENRINMIKMNKLVLKKTRKVKFQKKKQEKPGYLNSKCLVKFLITMILY